VQVAYETEFDYATELMATVADDYIGDEMAARIERYRDQLSETPVELEVQERPSVNVVQQESWVETAVSRASATRPARQKRTVRADPGRVQ